MFATSRDSSNAAKSSPRNVALTVDDVVTPSQNRAIFKSDGVLETTRDSRNAAIGRSRNGALTVVVPTPSRNNATGGLRRRARRTIQKSGAHNGKSKHVT